MRHRVTTALAALCCVLATGSCIKPELHLTGQEVYTHWPEVHTDLRIIWNADADWEKDWYYGWDAEDQRIWGDMGYPTPSSFQVRRYYTGFDASARHGDTDAFSVRANSFRRFFSFGYYDILVWSDIESADGAQVLLIDEQPDEVTATTTGTRGMSLMATKIEDSQVMEQPPGVVGLRNQPEIFYAAYPEDIYISPTLEDFQYDPGEDMYIRRIQTRLQPLVYIYLVQIILKNNDGRIQGINGQAAMSSMAGGTSLNTGHTNNQPSVIYFNTRLKRDKSVNGIPCDIVGGKFTTFGLCDMEPATRAGSAYTGTRGSLNNLLFFDLLFNNGVVKTYSADVTAQCQSQAHGGIITVMIDCQNLELPGENNENGAGSLFLPTIEDYEDVFWEIEM